MRRFAAVAIIVMGQVLAACPETAGCRSVDDCPSGYYCDLSVDRCARGDGPATVSSSGLSSVSLMSSSSSSPGASTSIPGSTSGQTTSHPPSTSASAISSSAAAQSSAELSSSSTGNVSSSAADGSSTSGTSSSSGAASSSSTSPGPPRITGGFVPAAVVGSASVKITGQLLGPPFVRSTGPNGVKVQGRFQ